MGADQVPTVSVHRQHIINDHFSGYPIEEEPDQVFPTRVEGWGAVLGLREDAGSDQMFLVSVLKYSSNAQGSDE